MKQQAKVVLENGTLRAEIIRPEACEACHACKYGRTERVLVDLPRGKYREGDTVYLTLPDGQVGIASLIAYGVPLAAFIGGLLIGGALFKSELQQAACALGFAALGFLSIKAVDGHIRQSKAFHPEAMPCAQKLKEDDQEEE